ncbi:hypothetical protein J6590_024212 [Homalodisca vitripennis]|nr:hypothetical protein J6590_024212 [Homalodisca vitripennis]
MAVVVPDLCVSQRSGSLHSREVLRSDIWTNFIQIRVPGRQKRSCDSLIKAFNDNEPSFKVFKLFLEISCR